MKFSKPLVLLLGAVLSASGVGCSAITAVVNDARPVQRENRGSVDRMVAIGRVFENQGRYDNAEAMYRKAQRANPQDPEIRKQLQQLAERQKEQQFGPSGTAGAIATADAVRPPRPASAPPVRASAEKDVGSAPAAQRLEGQSVEQQNLSQVSIHANMIQQPESTVGLRPNDRPQIELVSASKQTSDKSGRQPVTTDAVMAALDSPDQHADLLLEALTNGDCEETKCLAATLLGDCDPGNIQVRDALSHQHHLQSSPELLLAVCDSQIERGEVNQSTVLCLIGLCTELRNETQIQAAAQLRNFSGTEHESLCVIALVELLSNEESTVRATAAATLGDFSGLENGILTRLQELATADSSVNVREAAESALARHQPAAAQDVPSIEMELE